MRKKILALTFLNILFLIVACKSSEQEKNKDKESITHLKNSINYDNEATAIMNKYKAFPSLRVRIMHKSLCSAQKPLRKLA
jgi:uncharacterized protein YcfL